ncbi:hypothetical protein Golob_012376 [Gossypium lobatum]|uniref:F-box associated domain-containing protein n=1 Tax=Gossypium lobatum TaxID=34289 RepID=A0A7J8LL95_9ROSI|nr:hypothetical protein [Gossypium lobatum]
MNMKAMGGYLCLITSYTEFNDDVVDIWIMKESWIKLISWKKSESILGFPIVIPLAFSKSGDKVLFSIALHKFVWYDLGSKRVESLCGMIWEAKRLRRLGLEMSQLSMMWTCMFRALSLLMVML